MKITDFFLSKEYLKTMPVNKQKQIKNLIYSNIILFLYFIIGSLILIEDYGQNKIKFIVSVLITNLLFIISLFLIKFKKEHIASYLTSTALFLMPAYVGIFMPVIFGVVNINKTAMYFFGVSIVNMVISFSKRQTFYFISFSFISFMLTSISIMLQVDENTRKIIMSSFGVILELEDVNMLNTRQIKEIEKNTI